MDRKEGEREMGKEREENGVKSVIGVDRRRLRESDGERGERDREEREREGKRERQRRRERKREREREGEKRVSYRQLPESVFLVP